MTGKIETRLQELGIVLPAVPMPVANYMPWAIVGNILYVSGQLALGPDKSLLFPGTLGHNVSPEDGKKAARFAALNVLAVVSHALGGTLDRVKRVVKITGFVTATQDFKEHPEVVDGASALFVDVFGEAGRHTRAAVGVASLPRGSAVEVEAIFEIV